MSLSLPPSLRPWSAQLQELVPELALALGPMVTRLAAALGAFQSRPEPGRDSPEGLSGLARKGPYDRLLVSEWALAEEAPDEFVRRAASAEHLFLEIERKTPREGRRCIALFDAGPDQLGGPRLGHLALLVVLDRRAALAGAELHWQILQGGAPRVGAGRSELLALLAGRSSAEPSQSDLQRCLEAAALGPSDELWVIGGPEAMALAPQQAGRLLLEEPWQQTSPQDGGQDELIVVLSGSARARQEVRLPLPEPRHRTALLRRPLLEPTAEAIVPPLPGSRAALLRPLRPQLMFSAEGRRLLAREIEGALLAFAVPRLERRPTRMPLDQDDFLLAVGWSHQKLGCVVQRGGETSLETPSARWKLPESEEPPVPTERPSPLFMLQDPGRFCLVAHFVDGASQHWQWPLNYEPPLRESGVLAVHRLDGQLLVVGPHNPYDASLPLSRRVWFGPGTLQARLLLDGSWFLPHHGRIHGLPEHVWGVTISGMSERRPALLVSDGPGQTLRLVYLDGTDMPLASSAIAAASSGGHKPQVAWLDEQGLTLYDPIEHKRVACRPLAEEA